MARSVRGQVTWTIDLRAAMMPQRSPAIPLRFTPVVERSDDGFDELELVRGGDLDSEVAD